MKASYYNDFRSLEAHVKDLDSRLTNNLNELYRRLQRIERAEKKEPEPELSEVTSMFRQAFTEVGLTEPPTPPAALPTPEQVAGLMTTMHATYTGETVYHLIVEAIRSERLRRVVQGIDPEKLREIVEMWRLPTSNLLCMRQVEALLNEHDARAGGA